MGWKAYTKDGQLYQENDPNPEFGGRPVQKGEDGELAVVVQEDYGHTVAVDLTNGVIYIDYESVGIQNGSLELSSPKLVFWICEETNIVGELAHNEVQLVAALDEDGKPIYQRDAEGKKIYGKPVYVRNDVLTPLTWRPIWFTRYTMGIPTKVIGAQTTLPEDFGGRNVKKLISLFADGRIGID